MDRLTILLSLTSLTVSVGLSDSVDHFGNLPLSSGSWKTNFHPKFNVDHNKSILSQILLASKPNLLGNTKKDFNQKISNYFLHKSVPSSELIKNKFRNQPFVSPFHQQTPAAGIRDRPSNKTSSEFVDFDKYVSFGKPYKSIGTSTSSLPSIRSSFFYDSNKPTSSDNLTKQFTDNDSSTSFVFRIDDTTESVEVDNQISLDVNNYINFENPYKTEQNLTGNFLKQTQENQFGPPNETAKERQSVHRPDFNKYVSFGKPYKYSDSSSNIVFISNLVTTESNEFVEHPDLVDFDKYVSFGKPYKNEQNTSFAGTPLNTPVNINLTERISYTKLNESMKNSTIKHITGEYKSQSVNQTKSSFTEDMDGVNYANSTKNLSKFDQPIQEDEILTELHHTFDVPNDLDNLNTQLNISRNNFNALSVNVQEALGLPIAFQLPIEEHDYQENDTPVSKTKCERMNGKPLVVCIIENSKNISTITFDVPSKDSSMFAAIITKFYDTKTLRGINEVLNGTLTTVDPVAIAFEDTLPFKDFIIEENMENEGDLNKIKGSQLDQRNELLKLDGLIDAGNYEFASIDEGSGERSLAP